MSAKNIPDNVAAAPQQGLVMREKKRRRRTRPHEADILMAAYIQNPFPNDKARAQIAASVGMQPRAVSIWFQNRRQAEKKRSGRYCGKAQHGHKRDLQSLVPSNSILRPCPMRRTVSLPDASLESSLGGPAVGHLAPGLSATTEGRGVISGFDDRLWERMESSSVVNSSDAEDPSDVDDDERTLRRLAFRRSQQADARAEIRRTGLRRAQSATLPMVSSKLELAAARGGADKENMPPADAPVNPRQGKLLRSESMPAGSAPPAKRLHRSVSHAMPYAGVNRMISGGMHDSRARESSARSASKPAEQPELHDDSGFFDEGDTPGTPPLNATEHDRQAAELLLGLGIGHAASRTYPAY